jgi:ribosomal protein L6P/L9E
VDAPAHYNAPDCFRDPKQADERRFAVLATRESRVTNVLTGVHEGDQAVCGLI